jgi:hypothetical protein
MKANLFVISARNAPCGVIFRRGPSKQVLVIKWNLRNDTFESGQWLKGRIYERRCDLSPSGEKLIYFAGNYRRKNGPLTWTAVSKTPYLTALAMWPKGDAWGGGGLFESEYTILLNHPHLQRELAEGFKLGKNMKVRSFGEDAGRGEDNPIYHRRLLRDGWILKCDGEHRGYQNHGPVSWKFTKPRIYEKGIARKQNKYYLQMQIRGIGERQGDWYVIDHEIFNEKGISVLKLARTSWADWDENRDLLYAKNGKLFRLSWRSAEDFHSKPAKELIDLTEQKFKPVPTPAKARKW